VRALAHLLIVNQVCHTLYVILLLKLETFNICQDTLSVGNVSDHPQMSRVLQISVDKRQGQTHGVSVLKTFISVASQQDCLYLSFFPRFVQSLRANNNVGSTRERPRSLTLD
jgi:hypothetical protein